MTPRPVEYRARVLCSPTRTVAIAGAELLASSMAIGTPFHPRTEPSVRQPRLATLVRVPGGYFLRRLRAAGVRGHPQRDRDDRRLAALQVRGARARRGGAARSRGDPSRGAARRGPGALHPVVRPLRQGAPGRNRVPTRPRSAAAQRRGARHRVAAGSRARAQRRDRGPLARARRARAPGSDLARPPRRAVQLARLDHEARLLPSDRDPARRRAGDGVAHRLHRRSRLRGVGRQPSARSISGTR